MPTAQSDVEVTMLHPETGAPHLSLAFTVHERDSPSSHLFMNPTLPFSSSCFIFHLFPDTVPIKAQR